MRDAGVKKGSVRALSGVVALLLIVVGGWMSHQEIPPFPQLWSLKQRLHVQWQQAQLLDRLAQVGYQRREGRFAGNPDPVLLRQAQHKGRPVLLDLHPWNNDWLELRESLYQRAAALEWNVVRPDFGGPVRQSGHCCSDQVIASVDHALGQLRDSDGALPGPLLVLGESGGGMTAACWLAKGGSVTPAVVQMWGPVSNLARWKRQSTLGQPALVSDINRCTDTGQHAQALSPDMLKYSDKLRNMDIEIFAGIHDGYAGTVPPSHGLALFKHLALQVYGQDIELDMAPVLDTRLGDGGHYPSTAEGRPVLLAREVGRLRLTLFDGGHELLEQHSIARFCQLEPIACKNNEEEH